MFILTVNESKPKPDSRYVSINMPGDLADKIDELAAAANRTRGDVINQLLTHAVRHVQIVPNEKQK